MNGVYPGRQQEASAHHSRIVESVGRNDLRYARTLSPCLSDRARANPNRTKEFTTEERRQGEIQIWRRAAPRKRPPCLCASVVYYIKAKLVEKQRSPIMSTDLRRNSRAITEGPDRAPARAMFKAI